MTEGIVACGGGAGNGAFDFLREAVERAMRSPEARGAVVARELHGVREGNGGTVAGRLRRGGMRWSVDGGANPILTLRCWWLDGRYDGFFTARARPPPMALAA